MSRYLSLFQINTRVWLNRLTDVIRTEGCNRDGSDIDGMQTFISSPCGRGKEWSLAWMLSFLQMPGRIFDVSVHKISKYPTMIMHNALP
jgi:hypothetical protein